MADYFFCSHHKFFWIMLPFKTSILEQGVYHRNTTIKHLYINIICCQILKHRRILNFNSTITINLIYFDDSYWIYYYEINADQDNKCFITKIKIKSRNQIFFLIPFSSRWKNYIIYSCCGHCKTSWKTNLNFNLDLQSWFKIQMHKT